jgi:hypothetical protein
MAITLEEALVVWRNSYGGKIPQGNGARVEAFKQLFVDLEANGYTKAEVVELIRRNKALVELQCYNPNYSNKKALKTWKDLVKADLTTALVVYDKASSYKRGDVGSINAPSTHVEAYVAPDRYEAHEFESFGDGTESDRIEDPEGYERFPELDRSKLPKVEPTPMDEDGLRKELGVEIGDKNE